VPAPDRAHDPRGLDPQYLGSIRARPFRAGTDAEAAVSDLGLLPSMLGVSDLVVVGDHVDLRLAMVQPPGGVSGLVVLVPDRTDHTLRWHPFDAHPGRNERGTPDGGADLGAGPALPAGAATGADRVPVGAVAGVSPWRRCGVDRAVGRGGVRHVDAR
jgi:hypothetical protein